LKATKKKEDSAESENETVEKQVEQLVEKESDESEDESIKKASKSNGKDSNKKSNKKETTKKAKKESNVSEDEDDQHKNGMYELSKQRFVSLSEFKGKHYVNIREYYEKNGKLLPGNKGISLTIEQWEELKKQIPKIDKDIKKVSK
jgi:hypothetical protein